MSDLCQSITHRLSPEKGEVMEQAQIDQWLLAAQYFDHKEYREIETSKKEAQHDIRIRCGKLSIREHLLNSMDRARGKFVWDPLQTIANKGKAGLDTRSIKGAKM